MILVVGGPHGGGAELGNGGRVETGMILAVGVDIDDVSVGTDQRRDRDQEREDDLLSDGFHATLLAAYGRKHLARCDKRRQGRVRLKDRKNVR